MRPLALAAVVVALFAIFLWDRTPTVSPIEWLWLGSTAGALVLTLFSLRSAWSTRTVGNGARRLVARGNVRREILRIVAYSLLLVPIIPALFVDNRLTLTLPLLSIICVPPVLLLSTALDWRERREVIRIVTGKRS